MTVLLIIVGGFAWAFVVLLAYRIGRKDGIRSSQSELTSARLALKSAEMLNLQAARNWRLSEKIARASNLMVRSIEIQRQSQVKVEAMNQTVLRVGEIVRDSMEGRVTRRMAATGENPGAPRAPRPGFLAPAANPSGSWGSSD